MKERTKEKIQKILMGVLIALFILWVLKGIRDDQEKFIQNCMDKGYSYEYCMRKLRP